MGTVDFEDGNVNPIFGKRRKNLFIVSTLTLIIAIARPDFKKLNIFGMDMGFEDGVWLVWVGLMVWFVYAVFRAISYYWDYIREEVIERRHLYIYWNKFGTYWLTIAEKSRREIAQIYNQKYKDSNLHVGMVTHQGVHHSQLKDRIAESKIPGVLLVTYSITIVDDENQNAFDEPPITEEVIFKVDTKHWWRVIFRRLRYTLTDDWWEYRFAQFYASASFVILIRTLIDLF